MKKTITWILTLLLMLSLLTACGNEKSDSRSNARGHDAISVGDISDVFDYDESVDYDLVIAAYCSMEQASLIISDFEQKYGLNVGVLVYDENDGFSALDTKLMAKDDDIDLFFTASLSIYKYIQKGYYVDLSQFSSLKSKLDSKSYTQIACSYNGEYFGMCVSPYIANSDRPIMWKYLAEHLNLIEGTYSDPNGEELARVLKYAYDNPDDKNGDGYYNSKEYYFIQDNYLMMSPYSKNVENATLFLESMFDYLNGDFDSQSVDVGTIKIAFPENDNMSEAYLSWNITQGTSDSVITPLWDAYYMLAESDGSNETIQRLAYDAANKVSKQLEG